MKASRKIWIVGGIVIGLPIAVVAAFYLCAAIYFSGRDELAKFDLPNNHTLRVFRNREWDIGYNIYCQLEGPQFSHKEQGIGGGLYENEPPKFNIHFSTNSQTAWLTTSHSPTTIYYIVDLTTGHFWPDHDLSSEDGSKRMNEMMQLAQIDPGKFCWSNTWSVLK